MAASRSGRINRRRLVASSVLGGAAILTTRQPLLAAPNATQLATLPMRQASSAAPMHPGNRTLAAVLSSSGTDFSNGAEVIWASKTDIEVVVWPAAPAVANGIVYVAGFGTSQGVKGAVCAVAAKDGAERWRFTTERPAYLLPIVDEMAYVWDTAQILSAVNAENGTKQWQFTTGDALAPSPAVDGVMYVGGDDHNVHAIDAKTGKERWRFATGDATYSPVETDGVVYVGSDHLYAIDANDGAELWRYTAGDGAGLSVLVVDGMVYAGSMRKNLYAVNAKDGTERWRFTAGSEDISPVVAVGVVDGVVYAVTGTADQSLHAVNANDGTELWRFAINGLNTLTVVEGVVYVASADGALCAIDVKDGGEIWRFAPGDGYAIAHDPAAVDGVVYVGFNDSDRGILYALNATNGREIGRFTADDLIASAPAVVDGVAYVLSSDGTLYALGARVPKLSVGGTARVTEKTSLRGGPTPTAVQRAALDPGAIVTISDAEVTTGDADWWPVSVNETGTQGWVESASLEPVTSGPEATATD